MTLDMLPEYKWMLNQLDAHGVSNAMRHWILRAYGSHEWDWREADGCTGVCEIGIPSGSGYRSIPCILHDYLRFLVHKGEMSIGECDRLFHRAMKEFGWHPLIRNVRWFAVRWVFWPLWFRWRKRG